MARESIIIVGGGQAAGCAASELRQVGFDGRITIIGEEAAAPYERPPLSKEYLAGGFDLERAAVNPPNFYTDNSIDLLLNERVTQINPQERKVETAQGKSLPFDKLLIATGCRARRLNSLAPSRGAVVCLRTAEDAGQIARRLHPGKRLLLIGGGFIGLEVAGAARAKGCDVTVLEAAGALLSRVMPAPAAAFVEALHRAQGVIIETSVLVEGLEDLGDRAIVQVIDGRRFEADLVVIGIGAVPNQSLAVEAGGACQDGIIVDMGGRTSIPGVFAAGDVTRRHSSFYNQAIRLETWDNARRQAQVTARNMIGQEALYDEVPWMWTDHYGRNIQMLGLPALADEVVTRGDPESGPFIVISRRNGQIVAATFVDQGRERRPLTRLMRDRTIVPVEVLRDSSVPLKTLAEKFCA
ncbi:NAD(P)/FAD-dependent oxidoreductase [Limibacillus halophilus]|uniref:NADPH-dependent 2,4-dienoyl-CoA reductase/sulfur reductase-like enzyme n=1 Tax=Limibacillus halophilus TaxID=1579333 RepID=A0A839SN32_9PROT|nr:FAD-dependent oxidoreductase [Limibacillus halophilus]MBB3064307.1 NADPH-dependent 2,4-dienoyl-CoA reductase/sulfur reductase-like enzyme [Limibacillus halophilus]